MLGGLYSALAIAISVVALALLVWMLRGELKRRSSAPPKTRELLAIFAVALCALSVTAWLALFLSWTSADIAQGFGDTWLSTTSEIAFFSALAAVLLGIVGKGWRRWVGVGWACISLACWFFLAASAGITGASPGPRHPNKFLVPSGYVGTVRIDYGDPEAPPLPKESGYIVCKIPESGVLRTSSKIEDGWAKDLYFYYGGSGGSLHQLAATRPGRGGMIWGEDFAFDGNTGQRSESFFVGTEEQWHHAPSGP